jgi:putative polyketide hydroxylase
MEKNPVIIIGAGPTGLAMGIYLSLNGVPSIILERREAVNDHPRAHFIHTRTVELLHQLGIYDELMEQAIPDEYMPHHLFPMFGGMDVETRLKLAPKLPMSVAQDVVEIALQKKLGEFSDLCSLKRGMTFLDFVDDGDNVTIRVEDKDGQVHSLDTPYLVACDGAHSPIRKALGIEMIGDPELDKIINIYFYADLLRPGNIPSLGMPSEDRAIKGGFISMDGKTRWTFQYLIEDGDKLEDFTHERCEQIIRTASKMPADRPVEIKKIRPWTMSALIAEQFGKGRVLLAGDAAHAFPPSGGFGLNSGNSDVHNLGWKLALAWKGLAGPALLESYTHERQPIAYLNTSQSFRNSMSMNLRGDPKPFNVKAHVLEDIEQRATRSVVSLLKDMDYGTDEYEMMGILEHGCALGQEIGYVYYDSPVIVSDGSEEVITTVIDYNPHGTPGVRAPHFWTEKDGKRISSIELFLNSFTLLTGSAGTGWKDALAGAGLGSEVDVYHVGDAGLKPEDFDFEAAYGIDADGAVLVRPDGHIAFRAKAYNADAASQLKHAFATAIGFGNSAAAALKAA